SPEGTGILLHSEFTDAVTADHVRYQWGVTKNGAAYRPLGGAVPRYAGDPGDDDPGTGQQFSFIPDAAGTYVVTLTITGTAGPAVTTQTITVTNVTPTALIGGAPTASISVGTPVSLHGTFTDPGTNELHVFQWSVAATNGQAVPGGTAADFGFTPSAAGVYIV